jgi:hypothetical protein
MCSSPICFTRLVFVKAMKTIADLRNDRGQHEELEGGFLESIWSGDIFTCKPTTNSHQTVIARPTLNIHLHIRVSCPRNFEVELLIRSRPCGGGCSRRTQSLEQTRIAIEYIMLNFFFFFFPTESLWVGGNKLGPAHKGLLGFCTMSLDEFNPLSVQRRLVKYVLLNGRVCALLFPLCVGSTNRSRIVDISPAVSALQSDPNLRQVGSRIWHSS